MKSNQHSRTDHQLICVADHLFDFGKTGKDIGKFVLSATAKVETYLGGRVIKTLELKTYNGKIKTCQRIKIKPFIIHGEKVVPVEVNGG